MGGMDISLINLKTQQSQLIPSFFGTARDSKVGVSCAYNRRSKLLAGVSNEGSGGVSEIHFLDNSGYVKHHDLSEITMKSKT